ncbi:ATP-binding protein [Phenylobacterium sp.]|uniref:ATP-binding protein n=1 Tax=Phenylobacterium sp. TaxID=1871053 RepID=UPI002810F7D5|nr:ATP-binding protein [Phenylobacterium sp.]
MGRKTRSVAGQPAGLEQSGPVFDRATRLARTLFGPVEAQITLMHGAEVWRSRGDKRAVAGEAAGVRQVMTSGELLWVEDCRLDARFRDDPVVAGAPFVRFFAGAPIRLEDGTTPGAIWVAGLEVRPYDRSLANRLQDLADFVADEWTRVRAKDARSTYERTLSAIIDALPISLVLTDREMRVLYASPPWIEARGLSGRQVIGKTLYELRPDIFEQWRAGLEQSVAGGKGYRIERHQLPRADGPPEWVKVEVTPWRDTNGDVGGMIMASYDITAMVEALERTERSEERLKLAMEIAEIHVYEMDYVRRELVKVGAEDSFFQTPNTFRSLARDIWSSIDPRDRAAVKAAWERHVADGEPYYPEYRVARSDGQEMWVAGTARVITDEAGRVLRLIGAMQNITTRKAQEYALVRAKEEAEAANRAKSAFLATMSHEIRTPLNGVLGMAQAMAADDLTPPQRERLDVIRQSGESLLAILNDVLDLSKIEAGKLELEEAEFDLQELAQTVHATFAAVADAKGLDFELAVERGARGVYRGDPIRVRQILWNLVSNALKFTDRGGVRVRVAGKRGALVFEVADTGIGIAPEQLVHLFRKFEQADASTTRRFGGTGLGLAICRELTELMGGEISATSARGHGATFTVRLPLAKAPRRAAAPKRTAAETREAAPDRPLRVLAAEDNPMNQLVLKTLLAQVGVEPVIVPDGREAVAAWEREPWDVILMDIQMPVMDGPTATTLIRTREIALRRPRTPIVALTANAMSHQVAEYADAGMDGYVAKPIEAARLYEVLQAALEQSEAATASAA